MEMTHFYKVEDGARKFYDVASNTYRVIPGAASLIILDNLRSNKEVWKNSGGILHDLGDGVLNLEFRSKMNSIGGEVLQAINKSIEIAEKDFNGLVIGNDATNFSVGANLMMIYMLAIEQEYDELDFCHQVIPKHHDANQVLIYSCSKCATRNDFGWRM